MGLWPDFRNLELFFFLASECYEPGFCLLKKPYPRYGRHTANHSGGGLGAAVGQSGVPGPAEYGLRAGLRGGGPQAALCPDLRVRLPPAGQPSDL